MTHSLTRRDFLDSSARLLAGAGATSLLARTGRAESQPPAMLVGCRDGHLKVAGRPDCWSAMKALGAESVEASLGEDLALTGLFHPAEKYSAATPEAIAKVTADMKASGRRITALCMYNRFDQRPEFEIDWGTRAAKAAQALGIQAIRIDVVPSKLKPDAFLDFAVETLRKLIASTEGTGVSFGIENHGGTTNNPDFLGPLFERVGSKRLGLTLDIGNFYWYGHPLSKIYRICETFAPRVVHTHCKSIKYPEGRREEQRPIGWEYGKHTCPIFDGDIDYRRVVKILRAAGYANDLCVEDESLGHFPAAEQPAVLGKEIAMLKELRG